MTYRQLNLRLLCTSAMAVALLASAQSAAADDASQGSGVETVVVTGTRLQAQKIKEEAPNVLDLRLTEDIQQLPDVNLAEALQRIPGVSMESDTGEGRFINIRGMDADLNGTTFDGVRMTASNPSTPQGGARAVAFDALPSGLFDGVEVIKSLTPDMDAEGLGGVVNILPRTVPQGQDFIAFGTLGSGIETLRDRPVWEGDATVGGRFGPRDSITAVFSMTFHEDHRGIDDLENSGPSTTYASGPYSNYPIANDLEYRWYEYHRTRRGFGGNLSWDIDSSTTLFVRAFQAGYTEYANKNRLEIDNTNVEADGSTPVPSANGTFTVDDASPLKEYTDSKETVSNKLVEFGGHTLLGDVLADFRASWTGGEDIQPWSYKFEFSDPNNVLLQFNPLANPNYPTFQTLDGTNLADPANYTKSKLEVDGSRNRDQELAGVVDFTIPLAIDSYDGDFKFGGSVRERVTGQNATEPGEVKNVGPLTDYLASGDVTYYGNRYNIGPMANLAELAAIPESPQIIDPSQYEHNSENVFAGYGQYSVNIDKLFLQGGVRVESTNAVYGANIVDANDDYLGTSFNKQDYTNIFPDVNAKYQVTDDWLVRAAFTTSLARPGYNQITAAKTYDTDNSIVTQGNPLVKATTADNVDLTTDYHLSTGGVVSGGLFYKAFSNYIVPTAASGDCPSGFGFITPICQFQSFQNIGAADAKGIELSVVQQFTFLPDFWSGFGVDGNFTYVDTHGDIRTGENHALPQTSPRNFNAELFYDKGPLTMRLAASYVSTNLWQVGPDASQDLYSQARFRLDFGGSYKITDNLEWYVDVKNITNTKLEFTQTASPEYPVQREFYDADYFFGIRAHL